ncbi:MAG: fimbrillin family protein, partial [Dysgonamonadaceae bacterium]|nr:fimbrillin family protein [Dysgonamonadaceae bacterium]
AADGDYYTDGILRAGDNSVFLMVDSNTPYYVKAVSYNSTSAGDVPGIVTDNMFTATLPGLSTDEDVLYAETEITSGAAGSEHDINLTFSHKFSLVRVVADNAANTTGTITACSATLSNKYKASLALDGGALTAGSADGVHPFTWTSPNATAVTSNSATVYTGAQTTHVLAFTSITAGGITYTGTSVTFTKTFEPGKTYRLTVRFKGTTIPVIPTGGGIYPSDTISYVGAFWRASQTGERLIRIPVGTNAGNLGNWSAIVAWADARWNGLSDIVLDTGESADPGIKWNSTETPADMNDVDNDLLYQVAGNATGVGGTVASDGMIAFRIGLKFPYTATDAYPARYAVVVVTYGTPGKTFNLYLRQGEDPDYVWSPSEDYPYGGSTKRTSAVRFSPYNLTASGLTDASPYYSQVAVGGGVFTAYPTQAGAFFQWMNETNPRYAYHPVTPSGAPSGWDNIYPNVYWNTLGSTLETCPQNQPLTSGTLGVNFRRPNDGYTDRNVMSGPITGSEMRQSLWEVPQSSTTSSTAGSVWGFYADGFFDRRSHTHAAYGMNGVANVAVSSTTKDVAFIGTLFYNRDSQRSLFFPASGYRGSNSGTAGRIEWFGSNGFYWSSSGRLSDFGWGLSFYADASVRMGYSARNAGCAVRCVRD